MNNETLYHVFRLLSGCELAIAGATCKLWNSLSLDDSFWKHLFALYVGKTLFDKSINLEPGQWKKLFIDCFGSCDSGYTSFCGFNKILDEIHSHEQEAGKERWNILALRNRVRYIWQKRSLPPVYNVLDPAPVYFNTDLFPNFPLCLNFLSHTLREGYSSTDAKGILFNQNCPSRFAEISYHFIETDDTKLHLSATLIDLENKTQEALPIMDYTTSFEIPFIFALDMAEGNKIFEPMEDEYGNVEADSCYDRAALQKLVKHIDWNIESASRKFHASLASFGEPQNFVYNDEIGEHEFIATLYSLAVCTDLNRLRGVYFQKREGSLYTFMNNFYSVTEDGAETTEVWDLLLYSILQQKAGEKLDEVLQTNPRWAGDKVLESELKLITEEMQIFLQHTKKHPGNHNGVYQAKRYKAIKLFKDSEEEGEEDADNAETNVLLTDSQLNGALKDKKGYIILCEKINGDTATVEITIVTPRGYNRLATFVVHTSGNIEVKIGPVDVLLKYLPATTRVSGLDLIELISIYGDAYPAVHQCSSLFQINKLPTTAANLILNSQRRAPDDDAQEGSGKKQKIFDWADIMRGIMEKWTKEEKKKEFFAGKPSSLSVF